jgi:hypothetical protein
MTREEIEQKMDELALFRDNSRLALTLLGSTFTINNLWLACLGSSWTTRSVELLPIHLDQ